MGKRTAEQTTEQNTGPAVRAVCPQRRAWQRELLEDVPALRQQYLQASEAVEAARKLVDNGDKSPRYVVRFSNEVFEIAGRLNHIVNSNPVRLRESCKDSELNRAAVLLLSRRNRSQEDLQTMEQSADDCRRRWARLLKEVAAAFGSRGDDWQVSADELEILQAGRGHSQKWTDQERRRVLSDFQARLSILAEELALAQLQESEQRVEHSSAMAAFEENRQARTWSIH